MSNFDLSTCLTKISNSLCTSKSGFITSTVLTFCIPNAACEVEFFASANCLSTKSDSNEYFKKYGLTNSLLGWINTTLADNV